MSDDAISMILAALIRLETKVDRIEGQLAGIRDDIAVNMARSNRVEGAGENTRQEVRHMADELASLWRKVNRMDDTLRDLSAR